MEINMTPKAISKLLSLILRHNPDKVQLPLDAHGWADVVTLLQQCKAHGFHFSRTELESMVAENDKQRFAFNEDKTRIRASQGHSLSLNISLDLPPAAPPEYLYHGTVGKFVQQIRSTGIQKISRQHVHLSDDLGTAQKVGSRRGMPLILTIHSGQMHRDGWVFYLSANGVWLTDEVPPKYIQ
ncbi:RNA 2'-phosphotransferase [Chitinophaga eiseniae]|uniref:Probable RNA 2'-phosphotransferase n=2 Tax=Chitinophaga eiseniae TaxID=634771 RepID=A0A847S707_9BACT|nr:RNA 2'-phosphotransferase [Chitinophaga eiseniae]